MKPSPIRPGERRHARGAAGDVDGRKRIRQRVDAGILDGVVPPVVAGHLAGPQRADHVHGLLEHLRPDLPLGPVLGDDVLVEPLTRAHAEEEPPGHQRRGRRGGLGDDRRMDPGGGAGHPGSDADPLGRVGDRAEDAPDERALALAVDPRMVVIGDQREREATLLRQDGVLARGRAARAPRWTGRIRCQSCADSRGATLPRRGPRLAAVARAWHVVATADAVAAGPRDGRRRPVSLGRSSCDVLRGAASEHRPPRVAGLDPPSPPTTDRRTQWTPSRC